MAGIPASATLLGRWEWPQREPPPGRKYARWFELWEGYMSRGYQTGYQRKPHRWIKIRWNTGRTDIWQFSGRNYDQPLKIIKQAEAKGYRRVGIPAMSAREVVEKRWFGPIAAVRRAKGPTGWRKRDPAEKRRRAMLRSHGGDPLAAARACQALANVTRDPETRRKARADAQYLFRLHKRRKRE